MNAWSSYPPFPSQNWWENAENKANVVQKHWKIAFVDVKCRTWQSCRAHKDKHVKRTAARKINFCAKPNKCFIVRLCGSEPFSELSDIRTINVNIRAARGEKIRNEMSTSNAKHQWQSAARCKESCEAIKVVGWLLFAAFLFYINEKSERSSEWAMYRIRWSKAFPE